MSVCHTPSNRFFFCFSMEPSHFLAVSFPCGTTKRCFSIFDLGPLTPKIYSAKFGTKSLINRLVWQIDRRYLGLLGGLRGWPIQRNHAKCCGLTLLAMATKFWQIWAIFAKKSPVSRLVWHVDRTCFGLPGV